MYQTPKWQRVKLEEGLFEGLKDHQDARCNVSQPEHHISAVPVESLGIAPALYIEDAMTKHLGESFLAYTNEQAKNGCFFTAKGRSETPVKVQTAVGRLNIENHWIIAEEGAHATFIFDYSATDEAPSKHFGITRVIAKPGADITLIKVQRLGESDSFFDQCFSSVAEGARLRMVDIQMGAKTKVVTYESHLEGRHSAAELKSLYYGAGGEQLDLSFTMRHKGSKSESDILSKGVLDGDSKKIFRGNLLFDTGSPQSVGREREYVTLLSEEVQSDSIPALLCSEDDVIGEHAASVGQVDEMKLFYLMSRGISEREAKRLVIKAAFEEVLGTVADEQVRNDVTEALDRRLDS